MNRQTETPFIWPDIEVLREELSRVTRDARALRRMVKVLEKRQTEQEHLERFNKRLRELQAK